MRRRQDVGIGQVEKEVEKRADVHRVQQRNGPAARGSGGDTENGLGHRGDIFGSPIEAADALDVATLPRPQHLHGICTNLPQPVDLDFQNDRFDEDLFPSTIEIADDGSQSAVGRFGRADDDGIRRLVGEDLNRRFEFRQRPDRRPDAWGRL